MALRLISWASQTKPSGTGRKVVNVDLATNEEPHLLEYILAHYYLGDAEGAGLGLVLNALQEETGGQWALFLLAGVGWALRDNVENARTNFFTANESAPGQRQWVALAVGVLELFVGSPSRGGVGQLR